MSHPLLLRKLSRSWLICSILAVAAPALAVTPGIDIAAPRVFIITINSGFVFTPSQGVVEPGDYVEWNNVGTGSHTSTSGTPCVASGLWNFSLGAGILVQRQFTDAPGNLPFFCTPHCGLGMTGSIRVTTPIQVQTSDNVTSTHLTWSGGGPTYKVFASLTPGFAGAPPNTPIGGDTGTSFDDPTPVAVGQVCYYLVMNK